MLPVRTAPIPISTAGNWSPKRELAARLALRRAVRQAALRRLARPQLELSVEEGEVAVRDLVPLVAAVVRLVPMGRAITAPMARRATSGPVPAVELLMVRRGRRHSSKDLAAVETAAKRRTAQRA